MSNELKLKKCTICGKVVKVENDEPVMCCGKEMVDVLRMFKIGLKLLPKELPFSIFGLYMQINEKIENKEVYDNKIYISCQ